MVRFASALLVCCLVVVSTATATTFYVSPSGNNDHDGLSESTAWLSLDNGNQLGILQPGDSILILPGDYKISSEFQLNHSGTVNQPIIYKRIGKGRVRLDAQHSSNIIILLEGNHVRVEGLDLLNAKDDAIHIKSDSCAISSCFIGYPERRGIRTEGNYNLFSRNVIAYAGEDGIKNEDAGKFGNRYYNNTIYRATKHGIEIKGAVEECRVFNCIIVESGDHGITGPSNAVCGFNNVWGSLNGDYDGTVDSSGGISYAPRFVNADNERFDLRANASEISAGFDLGFSFNGSAPEMGAFEKYNVYWVSQDGDDNNQGISIATAWKTIDNGDSLLYPGDTVYILPGTYPDSIVLTDDGLSNDNIVYKGVRDSTIVQGIWHSGVSLYGDYVTLQGLTVKQASGAAFSIQGSVNTLYECRADSSGQYGVIIATGTKNSIVRSVVTNSLVTGILVGTTNLSLYHNTFVNNGDFDIDASTADGLAIVNCIFVGGNSSLIAVRAPAAASMRYCLLHNYPSLVLGGVAVGTGCFSADPQFINGGAGNYRLMAASPAIDVGEYIGVSYEGSAPDLGAFETGTPANLSITPRPLSMVADSQYQFSIEAVDALGFPAKAGSLDWSHTLSSGFISSSGLFTPELTGNGSIAVLAVSYGLVDTTELITIVPGSLDKLEISPSIDTISADSSQSFTAIGSDSKGNSIADLGAVVWSILNNIGEIDSTGLFSAGKSGKGFVTATSSYGVDGISDTITVVPGAITSIAVNPSVNIVVQDSSYQYDAFGYDTDLNLVGDLTVAAGWNTTDPSGVVGAAGLYTAGTDPSPPSYWVTADWGGLVDSGQVAVITDGLLTYIQVEYSDGTPVGDTVLSTDNDTTLLYARGYDSGDNLLGDVACAWRIAGSDSIGIPLPPNGSHTRLQLTRAGLGQIVVEYSSDIADTSGTIFSQAGLAARIVISPDSAISVNADSTLIFTVDLYDADGNKAGIATSPSWGVAGEIGSIAGAGQFSPERTGGGYVFVSSGGLADTSALITVIPGALVRIEALPDTAIVTADSLLVFSAQGFDSENNQRDPGQVTWQVTLPIGSIDSIGVFDPVSVGDAQIIATSVKGPVDTTSILTVSPGKISSIEINPDSINITTDSIATFSVLAADSKGNNILLDDFSWSSLNGLGEIDAEGHFDPNTVGIDQIIAWYVADNDTIADTTSAVVIHPGALDRFGISPNSGTLNVGDQLLFSVIGYDRDFNVTTVSDLEWSVLGDIGLIDSTGLFTALSSGIGFIQATNLERDISATTNEVTVEALRVIGSDLSYITASPGEKRVPLLKCRLDNDFSRLVSVDGLSVRSALAGAGNTTELLSNIDSLHLHFDLDDNGVIGPSDSLVASAAFNTSSINFAFDAFSITALSGLTLVIAADVSLFARDSDVLDLFLYPALDVSTNDGTAVEGVDSLNSLGNAVIDGLISDQIQLNARPSDSVRIGDSLVFLAELKLPRNGYEEDTLRIFNILNSGSAIESDIDSLLLYADNGDGLWGGPEGEIRLADLVYTGSHWTRSGLTVPLTNPYNQFYVAGKFAEFATNGASLLLTIPDNGISVQSGNDGPIDGSLSASDSVIIKADQSIQVSGLSIPSRTLIPGHITGPVLALQLFNGTQSTRTLEEMAVDFVGLDPDGATKADLDSQIDSVGLYLARDADYTGLGSTDSLISVASIINGEINWTGLNISLGGAGESTELLISGWLSESQAKNGNEISFSLIDNANLSFDSATTIDGIFPIANDKPFTVDAFQASSIVVTPIVNSSIFGGDRDKLVFDIQIPANGYRADTVDNLDIVSTGTVPDDVVKAMYLYLDKAPADYGLEDSLLATMSYLSDRWNANMLQLPVPVGGARLFTTVDVSDDVSEGGSFVPTISVDGIEYSSGMVGPDDSPATSKDAVLVFPSNRVTAVSIPLGTAAVQPSSSGISLLNFALYNGYLGQSRHLTRLALTNTSISKSDSDWADEELGQVQLHFDSNRSRSLDDDLLVGTGYFSDGGLILGGMNVELPPESLSYFFVTSNSPLDAIDGDSLSVSIAEASDFGFAEPVSLNGDLPITRGGYLIVDGSIAEQYTIHSIPSRTLSAGDSNIVLMSFLPAKNGDQRDTLTDLSIGNLLSATDAEFSSMTLWSDLDDNRSWQGTDALIAAFSYSSGTWQASGFEYEIDYLSKPLIVVATVSDTARSGRAFRGLIDLGGCEFKSDNDGPIDQTLAGGATFTVSSSALKVEYGPLRTSYSVGESIALTLEATNRLGVALDSVFSQVVWTGDLASIAADSLFNGPMTLEADSTGNFRHYYRAIQAGSVTFRSKAIATAIGDSSAIIESDQISIQNVPSGLELALNNYMPTAVARGQQNIFPLSLSLNHGDVTGAAPIRIDSIRISVLDAAGIPQLASNALSRILLADENNTLSVITTIPDSTSISIEFNPELILYPADTTELVFLIDIASGAIANDLILGIESAGDLVAVDANTGALVTIFPSSGLPLRTASCRIDEPATTLAVSDASESLHGVNVGQDDVQLLSVGLRHPGTVGMSQVQLIGLSLSLVDGVDTLLGSDVADKISVYRSSVLLGEATGTQLDNSQIAISLGSGLTINPDVKDSLLIKFSVANDISVNAFQIVISDSSKFTIRDIASGSDVIAVTDQQILATGSVFPLVSSIATVYQPSEEIEYCLSDALPSVVVSGTDSVDLLSVSLHHLVPNNHAPVRVSSIAVRMLDSLGAPLAPTDLFDRTGYRVGTGEIQYYQSLTLVNGATVFPLADTGLVLMPSESVDFEMIGDIESDSPYDNFQLVLDGYEAIKVRDEIDSTNSPALVGSISCDTLVPYSSKITSVFKPAGAPVLEFDERGVQIAAPGHLDFDIGDGYISYLGQVQRGDLEFESLTALLLRKTGSIYLPVAVSSLFSRVYLTIGGSIVAVDSVLSGDTLDLAISPSLILSHGAYEDISLSGDMLTNAEPGSYSLRIVDSTALRLYDYNLGIDVHPLVSGGYPLTVGSISIAAMDLRSSFSNYPNPFVPSDGPTTIAYVLPEDARIDIDLFTITGDPVAHIAENELRSAGPHQDHTWNGENDLGLKVVPGTYFCRITAHYLSGKTETARRKVAVVR